MKKINAIKSVKADLLFNLNLGNLVDKVLQEDILLIVYFNDSIMIFKIKKIKLF